MAKCEYLVNLDLDLILTCWDVSSFPGCIWCCLEMRLVVTMVWVGGAVGLLTPRGSRGAANHSTVQRQAPPQRTVQPIM